MIYARPTNSIGGMLESLGLRKNFFDLAAKILFILVLWKHSGVRLWPHVYAGQVYQPGRIVYYTEFLISMVALALFFIHLNALKPFIKRQLAVCIFALFALLIRFLPGSENLSPFLITLGYWDSIIALSLMVVLCGPLETRDILAKFGFVFIAINLASLAIPSVSMMIGNFSGYARGLTAHRNDLAHVSVIAIFFILCSPKKINPLLKWGAIFGGVALVVLAGSVQGIFLLGGGLLIFQTARFVRVLKHPYVILCIVMFIAIAATLRSYFSLEEFLQLFGRDATFTGRDRIWALSLYLIERMPWSGYGVGSVGSNVVSPALLESFKLGSSFGTAHNSYLEAILSFGWLGGGLFLIAVLTNAVRVFNKYFRGVSGHDPLPAMIMLVCVVGGFTSSEKMFWPTFGWLSFVIAIALIDNFQPRSSTDGIQKSKSDGQNKFTSMMKI